MDQIAVDSLIKVLFGDRLYTGRVIRTLSHA